MSFGIPELDRQMSQVVDSLSKVGELQERLTEVRGVGEAADGRVRVVTDHTGQVVETELDPRALKLGSEELGAAFVEAAQQAYADLTAQAQEVMSELMPGAADLESLKRVNTEGLSEEAKSIMDSVSTSTDPSQALRQQVERMRERFGSWQDQSPTR